MSVEITIQGTVIEFPETGESANWAPAVVEFAQAVEDALSSVIGDFDVFPQTFILSNNANTNLEIPNLNFPISEVRSATIRYSVYRETGSNVNYDTGTLIVTYDSFNDEWSLSRGPVQSNSDTAVTFDITSDGQVRITTSTLSGSGYSGRIGYTAQALKQT